MLKTLLTYTIIMTGLGIVMMVHGSVALTGHALKMTGAL